MIIRFIGVAIIIAAAIQSTTSPPNPIRRGSRVACRAADAATAREIRRWQSEMHSTDPDDSLDISHARLRYVPDSAFAVVSDSATCARALAAHNKDAGYTIAELATADASSVYVIRVGTRYITWNPAFRTGEWVTHVVWSDTFTALSHYLH